MSAGVDDSGEGWVGGETGATGDGVGSVSGVTGEEDVSGDTGKGVSGVTGGVVGSGLKETTGDGVGEATGELDCGGIVAAGMRVADLDGAGGLDDAGGLVLRPWSAAHDKNNKNDALPVEGRIGGQAGRREL